MQTESLLDTIPLWGLFIALLLLVLLSIEGGYRLGKFRFSRSEQENEAPIGAMVGATLGLFAFILAFTFGATAERFDSRKKLVLDEANAIGTTYLRAGMLPDRQEEIRGLLRGYVDVRLEAVHSGNVAEGIRRSENIQDQLWAHAVAIGQQNPNSIVVGLFIQSLNDVIDLHAKRVTAALRNRIPDAIWAALLGIGVLSLAAVGYHTGLVGTRRSLAILAVACAFSTVLTLIADLDRTQEGAFKVSQQALADLRQTMKAPGQ
jgi:hypothetical protein